MTSIIAGRFDQQEEARRAEGDLLCQGFSPAQLAVFFVGAPGQHDQYPGGGDRDESPGAEGTDTGAATAAGIGGAIGFGVGLAATPFWGPSERLEEPQ